MNAYGLTNRVDVPSEGADASGHARRHDEGWRHEPAALARRGPDAAAGADAAEHANVDGRHDRARPAEHAQQACWP